MKSIKPRIIVYDDDLSMRDLYKNIFEKALDATVLSANTAEMALREAIHSPPDLFISDIYHPGITGVQMTKELRGHRKTKGTTIWIISGNAHTVAGVQVLNEGADVVLSKPFRIDDILDRAVRLFEFSKSRDLMLIDAGIEGPDLDYKQAIDVSSNSGRANLAKDIIGFANFGGGTIIVGIKESPKGSFSKIGIALGEFEKYEVTNLNKAITDYIDPGHYISSRIVNAGNKAYVIIEVPPANSVPLLARKENLSANLMTGRIYTRNSCAETTEAKRSEDIRQILDRVTEARRIQRI